MGEPRTISIKVTFTDEDLYENFIEPRKINAELPTLVVRLLTAYAQNEDLATQIDQFIDQTENPEIYEARNAIMDAIARISALDSMATQELERLDGEEGFVSDDEVDVVTGADGEWTPDICSTAEPGYSNYEGGTSDVQSLGSGFTIPSASSENMGTHTDSVVLASLESLTKQVSSLTSAVSQMVDVLAPRVGDLSITSSRVDFPSSPATVATEASVAIEKTGGDSVDNASDTSEDLHSSSGLDISITDTAPTASQGTEVTPSVGVPDSVSQTSTSNVEPVAVNTDNSDTNAGEDDYDIPDFMFDMLKSIG